MHDLNILATDITAGFLWATGVVLVVVHALTGLHVEHLGLLAAMGGGTMQVRGYLCRQHQQQLRAMEMHREAAPASLARLPKG